MNSLQSCNRPRGPHQPVTAPIRRVSAGRAVRDLIRGALLGDGHVPQGPLQGGASMCGCAVAITWCVGRRRLSAAWPWGRVIEGVSSLQYCNSSRGPHHQPVTAPIWRVSAGRVVRDQLCGSCSWTMAMFPRICSRVALIRGGAMASTWYVGLNAVAWPW
ncbi:hypothetical protein [Aeromonas caviae]|uniref:hypothetical protein n=1 Tax=Aeromonas caviae TaxID=648 RepID=UPI001CC6B13E|nr:hypothetical protein [Aeromonas caviae]